MVKRYKRSNTASMAEFVADYLEQRDEEVMQALLAAGMFVACADGQVTPVERDELLDFIDRQGFAPHSSRDDISETLDSLMRQLQAGDLLQITIELLRPVAGLSLSSVVVRTAERVAAADHEMHPAETEAIQVIRQILMKSAIAAPVANRMRN
jgi:tellurite resistance protein